MRGGQGDPCRVLNSLNASPQSCMEENSRLLARAQQLIILPLAANVSSIPPSFEWIMLAVVRVTKFICFVKLGPPSPSTWIVVLVPWIRVNPRRPSPCPWHHLHLRELPRKMQLQFGYLPKQVWPPLSSKNHGSFGALLWKSNPWNFWGPFVCPNSL